MSDTTIRDQLADVLRDEGIYCGDCDYGSRDCPECGRMLGGFADAILAAGFRPPARVITTVEERDALPPGSVVLSDSGYAWQRIEWWWQSTDEGVGGAPSLPATILHVPTEEATDGE